jgi:hypothetical protein
VSFESVAVQSYFASGIIRLSSNLDASNCHTARQESDPTKRTGTLSDE